MAYQQCKTCDEPIYEWRPPHKCKPKRWCWLDDGDGGYYETDDGGTAVYAHDARYAAEKFCSEYPERGDWADCVTVVVKSPGDEWVKVVVSAQWEWTADYEDPEPFTPIPLVTCKYCLSDVQAVRRLNGALEFPEHNNKGGRRCLMSTFRIVEEES